MKEREKGRVTEYIHKHKREIVGFLAQLIKFRSINDVSKGIGKELEIQEWLKDELSKMGFDKIDYWAVDKNKVRPNLVATIRGEGGGRSLIFNGHIDVVPVPKVQLEAWTVDPWEPVIKNGMVYGRGATDMKGGIASMIWSAKALIDNNVELKGDIHIECVVGEESLEHIIGTSAVVDRGYTAPLAVIQEPTNCEIHLMSSGFFCFELKVLGKPVHSSCRNLAIFPQRYGIPSGSSVGVDAIAKTIPFIELFQRLEVQLNHRWRDKILGGGGYPLHEDNQGIGIFTINPSFIDGGTHIAAVPGYCKLTYCVWHPPWISAEEVCQQLKEHVSALASTDEWLVKNPPEFNGPLLKLEPNVIPLDHQGVKKLMSSFEEATGKVAIISGFKAGCDATFLLRKGIPTIIFGPGDISMGAHGLDEYVPIQHLIDVAKTNAVMAINWCGW